jgi:ABC-2 type transport system ATP-binding protein
MMPDPFIIETSDLRKTYGEIEAVRGLDLRVPAGSIYGLLGKNGAGKTTTIKLLLGMARPTAGQLRVFGLDAARAAGSVAIRSRTGFVAEDKPLYDYMTVAEMVRFTAAFYPRWRPDLAERYVRAFDLPAGRKVKALSRGMRTKLALLLALCRGAELLVLDEPTSGLDPAVTEEVLQALVRHVATQEMTVFLSSHQIAQVDQVADGVAIIDGGRAVVSGPLDDLRGAYRRVQMVFDAAPPAAPFRSPGIVHVRRDGRAVSVLARAGADRLVEEARSLGACSVDVAPVTLREIFLETVSSEN